MKYLIEASDSDTGEQIYWSNEDGWVDRASADVFSEYEHENLRLPDDGAWIELPVVAKLALNEAIASLPETVTLAYANQGDELSPEQVQKIFDGNEPDVLDAIEEWVFYNPDYDPVAELFKEHAEPGDRRLIREGDLYQHFEEAARERDDSDVFREIRRYTPAMLVRYDLDYDVQSPLYLEGDDYEQELRDIAELLGIEFDANKDALDEMLANASYGGGLCVLWKADIEAVCEPAAYVHAGGGDHTISWTNPHIVTFNLMNGSGWMCEVKGTVTRDFDPNNLHVDKGRGSWSEWVCGGLSGVDDTCTITKKEG